MTLKKKIIYLRSYLKCDGLDLRVGEVNEMALVCTTLVAFIPAVD